MKSFWDRKPDGMLHVELVRSDVRHGQLKGIQLPSDPDRAGVVVVDHRDLRGRNLIGSEERGRPVFAARRIVHVGEAVAAVAAADESVARSWAESVKIEVEEKPEVADVEAAMAARVRLQGQSNVYFDVGVRRGATADGLSSEECVVEETFALSRQLRHVLGSVGVLVEPTDDGSLAIWTNCGDADILEAGLRGVLVPEISVTVQNDGELADICQGELLQLVAVAALVSMKSGAPCRCVWRPNERLAYGSGRPAAKIQFEATFSRKGRCRSLGLHLLLDGGAHGLMSQSSAMEALQQGCGVYGWECTDSRAVVAATNNTPDHALRGEGFPQVTFGREQLIDRAAEELNMSPGALRLINLVNRGSAEEEMLSAASEWVEQRSAAPRTGRALGVFMSGGVLAVDAVAVDVDAVSWEVRVTALHSWRVRGSTDELAVRIDVQKDVAMAGFEDVLAAAFGVAALRPPTSVDLPPIEIHWVDGDAGQGLPSTADESPATGAGSAFVSAVAQATNLRATDLPLLPEMLVDLHLLRADQRGVPS